MQEVNNTETQQQTTSFVQENNKLETTQTSLSDGKPKQSSFLITLLSVLLLLACIIAGFFAYQTQTLVKELVSVKDALQATPDPTIESVDISIVTEDKTEPVGIDIATNSADPTLASTASPSSTPIGTMEQ